MNAFDRTAASLRANSAGKAFESRIESILDGYRVARTADLEKIDPPVKVVGTRPKVRVIFLENPWLDYGGVWTARGGRAIYLEAKSTNEDRLPMGRAGIRDEQIASIERWTAAGAITAVAWGHDNEIRILTGAEVLAAWSSGAKSIRWRHVPPVARGLGFVEFDILGAIAERT